MPAAIPDKRYALRYVYPAPAKQRLVSARSFRLPTLRRRLGGRRCSGACDKPPNPRIEQRRAQRERRNRDAAYRHG